MITPGKFKRWKLPVAFALVLTLGGVVFESQRRFVDAEARWTLLSQAISIARTLNKKELKALTFTSADVQKPEYRRLQHVLRSYAKWTGLRAIYTVAKRDGELYFGPESMDPKGPMASLPGTRYKEAQTDFFTLFQTRVPGVIGPYTDEFGSFVSALTPILDPRTDQVAWLLGVDLPLTDYRALGDRAARVPVLYSLGLTVIVALGGMGGWLRQRLKGKNPWIFRHLDTCVVAGGALLVSAFATHLAHLREIRTDRAVFRELAEVEMGTVASALGHLQDDRLPQLAQALRAPTFRTRPRFHEIARQMIESGELEAVAWVDILAKDAREPYEATARRDGDADFRIFEFDKVRRQVPAFERSIYFPVRHVIPESLQPQVQGFDMGSEGHRRAAFEESLASGLPATTEPIFRVTGKRSSLLVFPVGENPSKIIGFIVAVVNFDGLLRRAFEINGHLHPLGHMELFHLHTDAAPVLLANRRTTNGPLPTQDEVYPNPGLQAKAPVFLFNKPFGVRLSSGPELVGKTGLGTVFPVLFASLLFATLLIGFVASVVGKRRSLERQIRRRTKALRESEAAYRQQFQSNREIMLLVDPDTAQLLDVNRAAVDGYGYSREQLLRMSVYDLVPGAKEEILTKLGEIRRSGAERFEGENRLANGEIRKVEVSASLVHYEERVVLHVIVIDITERKKADAALRSANDRLEATTVLAREMAEKAARANNAKSEFLANMSHEIRTPLNAIVGMTGLLLETPLSSEQQRYLQILRSSGQSLLLLINEVLDLSKIEAGKLTLECLDFHLRDLVDDLTELVAIRAHGKGLNLYCIVEPDVPHLLQGDANRLRQVLLNLVTNAIKFTHAGEIILRVAPMDMDDKNVTLQLSVQDTGIGIPQEKIASLFQPFTQVDSSTMRKFGGTGLGLAISKKLVELMGGTIRVQSEDGKGSTFSFVVPLLRQDTRRQVRRTSDGIFASVAVLVADPHPVSRESIVSVLKSMGCALLSVGEKSALEHRLREGLDAGDSFQIVIVDPSLVGDGIDDLIASAGTAKGPLWVELKSPGRPANTTSTSYGAQLSKPVRTSALREIILKAAGMEKHVQFPQVLGSMSDLMAPGRADQRILVVEDNPTNQIVTTKIVEKLGYQTEVAENGWVALEKLAHQSFDLVLMDCQMPEMDGYEATRRIRSGEAGHSDVIIVALTAHSQSEDRQKCIEAGMNDYVSKPVQPTELARVLIKWFAREEPSRTEPAKPKTLNPKVWDRDALSDRVMGDEGLVKQILGVFLADLPSTLRDLEHAIQITDYPRVAKLAHRLKGACLNVAAAELADTAKAMELAGKASDELQLQSLLPRLHAESEKLRVHVEGEGPLSAASG